MESWSAVQSKYEWIYLSYSPKSPHSSPLGDLMTLISENIIMSETLSWMKWVWYFLTSLFTRFHGANISREDCSFLCFHSVKKGTYRTFVIGLFQIGKCWGCMCRVFYKRGTCCSWWCFTINSSRVAQLSYVKISIWFIILIVRKELLFLSSQLVFKREEIMKYRNKMKKKIISLKGISEAQKAFILTGLSKSLFI